MAEFRKAQAADWPLIRQIAYATWPATFGHIIPAGQLDYMLDLMYNETSLRKQIVEKGHQFIVAEQANRPLGFISYELHYQSLPQLMIHKFYLLPGFQGLGIGTKLLNLLSKTALENNDRELRLKVYHKNDKAIGYYQRYGFKNVGTETTGIGNNYIILDNVMVKELP